jgi:aarF domain-containing kinase
LDAARLLNASRSIAKQHLQLRSQQLDVYSKTSTLAKAVKTQTDRVTLTAQAAAALASRLNEQQPTYPYSTAYPSPKTENRQDASIPRDGSDPGGLGYETVKRESLNQDHRYTASEGNAAEGISAVSELSVRQEKPIHKPLPDGTLPPLDYDFNHLNPKADRLSRYEHSADVARHHQRRAEAQIPSITSAGPSTHQLPGKIVGDHDQDVYYDRPKELNMDYSSLPRAKIPKHVGERQEGSEKVNEQGINADTYYSTGGSRRDGKVVKHTTGVDSGDVPEGININVFRTPKVLATGQSTQEASRRPQAPTTSIPSAVESSTERLPGQSESSKWKAIEDESKDDIHRLANDIAKDTQSFQSDTKVSS